MTRPDDDADWREYEFKGKPGDRARDAAAVGAVPPAPRLADVVPAARAHVGAVVRRVPRAPARGGSRRRCALLRTDPFDGQRAARGCVRDAYHYRFTTHAEYPRDGHRWVRTFEREVIGPAGLR